MGLKSTPFATVLLVAAVESDTRKKRQVKACRFDKDTNG